MRPRYRSAVLRGGERSGQPASSGRLKPVHPIRRKPQRIPWWWYPASHGNLLPRYFPAAHQAERWVRAIDVDASPEVLFAWVTQLRRAPYSYDWVDNFGRRSPQSIDRRLIQVSPGHSVMTIFTVTAVIRGTSMTVRMNRGTPTLLFGALTVHYEVEPRGVQQSRLIAELVVPPPPGPLKTLRRYALAWGDFIMMRKQLKELKRLAELSESGNQERPPCV